MKFTTMIIDDEQLVREGLCQLIDWQEEEYELLEPGVDGQDGLEKILRFRPDLVLVDIKMPGFGGLEVIRRAKEQGFEGSFLILTGYSEFEYAKAAISMGVEGYLLKPIDEDELLEYVRKIHERLEKDTHLSSYHRENEEKVRGDGHMLFGWQQIENNDGGYDTYYLGTQDEGYAHMRWQYLIPDDDLLNNAEDYDYDGYEMFYFGWDGVMSYSEESKLEGCYFMFDENGVMSTGWQPGINIEPGDLDFGVNKYYDKVTGVRASGWLYTWDPDDNESGECYWFYCDKSDGQIYNEGGKDGDGGLAYKKINGKTYFFDENGHMIYGLIATDGTDLGDNPFVEEEFESVSGDIGIKPAGIYYLSNQESNLGQMADDGALKLKDGPDSYEYYISGCGRAYTNAIIKGCVYGEDGLKITSDSGRDVVTLDDDIYEKDAFVDGGLPEDTTAEPRIPAGSQIIVNKSGKVMKKGKVKIEGTRYIVEDYIAIEDPDQD